LSDIDNLMKAYVGESQARFRYKLYAEKARDESYEQIAEIFEKTAAQETEHAEIFFLLLKKYAVSPVSVNADYPVVISDSTLDNLKYAANGEHEEWTNLYQTFADQAINEDVKNAFLKILKIEKNHERRFNKLICNIDHDQVFKKHRPVKWECRNCGHIHEGLEALGVCPTCGFSKAFAEVEKDNY
jgi:rubrerythrin